METEELCKTYSFTIPGTKYTIEQKDCHRYEKISKSKRSYWWLLEDSQAVGCLSTCLFDNQILEKFIVNFIEIKKDSRNKDLSRLLVEEVEKIVGEKLFSPGEGTLDSMSKLKFIPILGNKHHYVDSSFKSFVKDWDSMEVFIRPKCQNAKVMKR